MVTAGLEWQRLHILVCDWKCCYCEWTRYCDNSHLYTHQWLWLHCPARSSGSGVCLWCLEEICLWLVREFWRLLFLLLDLITLLPLLFVDADLDIPQDIYLNFKSPFPDITNLTNLTNKVNQTQAVCMYGWVVGGIVGMATWSLLFSLTRRCISQSVILWRGNFFACNVSICLAIKLEHEIIHAVSWTTPSCTTPLEPWGLSS